MAEKMPWELAAEEEVANESLEETFSRAPPWELDPTGRKVALSTSGLKSEETFREISNRWSQGLSSRLLRGLTLGASANLPNIPEKTQENIVRFEEEHPVISGVAEVAGGLTGGVSGVKTVARYTPKVSQWITRKVPAWVQMATGGGVAAGIYSANVAKSGERAKAGAIGAGTGAIAGPVLGTAMRMAAALGKGTWGAIQRMLANTSERQAERILRNAIDAEDLSPEFIRQELDRLGEHAVLADVSEGLARTARGAAAIDSGAHGVASSFLKQRQAGQVGRLTEAAGGDDFDATNFARSFSRWLRSRKTAAGDAYDEAYKASLEPTDRLVTLMNRPSVKSAMDTAAKNISEEGGGVNDVRFFQFVKEELDDRIGEALRAGRRNEARRLINTKNALIEEIDNQVPVYREARNTFSGEQQLKDSAEMGYEVVTKPSKDLWIIEEAVESMTESEAHAFRQGALRGVIDRLDKSREGRNVAATMIDSNRARQLLRMIFPDETSFRRFVDTADAESAFSITKNTVTGGSPTSRIDSDKAAIEGAAGVASAMRQGGDTVSMALRLFKELGVGKPSPEALKIVNETLFSRYSNIGARAAKRPTQQSELMQVVPYSVGGGVAGERLREEVTE
jgi:hypothetical protein